jgi:hypothetical protein
MLVGTLRLGSGMTQRPVPEALLGRDLTWLVISYQVFQFLVWNTRYFWLVKYGYKAYDCLGIFCLMLKGDDSWLH